MKRLNFENLSLGIIGIAILLVVVGLTFFITENKQNEAINAQTNTTNALIKQVRDISQRNEQLNQENKDYAYCTAQLIARYTRDKAAITIDDLKTCALSSFPSGSEPRGVTGDTSNTALQEVQRSDGNVVEIPRPYYGDQSSGSSTTNNTTNNTTNPTTPSQNPQTQAQNSSPILTVPNLLNLQAPCLNVLGLAKTC